jgi:hypothetical protein
MAIDHPTDATLLEVNNVEVQEKSHGFVGQYQVHQQLRLVDWANLAHGLHLYDDRVVDEQIHG